MTEFQPGITGRAKRSELPSRRISRTSKFCRSLSPARTNALPPAKSTTLIASISRPPTNYEPQSEHEAVGTAGFAHYVAPMNCTIAPFDNNNVRLALKYAIDREEIVKKVLLGHGSAGNDNPIAPGVPFSVNLATKHSYDPDKARFHLKQAGMTSIKVELSAADAAFAGALDAAQLMAASAKSAGIDIAVLREPNDSYWDNVWLRSPGACPTGVDVPLRI